MLSENRNCCSTCTHGWNNFKNLSEEELLRVNQHRFEATFKAGEIIFKQGTPCSNIIFLVSGFAKISLEGLDNKKIILNFVQPGRMIVGPGLWVDNRHNYSLSALTDVVACFVDSGIIKEMVKSNSRFAEGYINDLCKRSLASHDRLLNLTQKKMHGRLAEGILFMADTLFKSDKFDCIMTRQEIGDFTNMSKESVVRILNKFHSEGILSVNNTMIEILDKKRLQQIMISG
jgi:CRP/FNR family transcriptional regulator, polysaccharide utilization system transcription regulator